MKNKGFTIIEMAMVFLILCAVLGIIISAKKLVKIAKLANAVNLSTQIDILDNGGLVLWLETSNINRNNKSGTITIWKDLSKNKNEFKSNSGSLAFSNSSLYNGIKAIKFDGTNYLESSTPLNLNKYTAFLVAIPNSNSSSTKIFDSGFVATTSELSSNRIVVIKNNGSTKYIKSVSDSNFTTLSSNPDDLTNSPLKFYIGNDGFNGEILEIMIFDRILDNSEIGKIENYLINKYIR
jgi:hypothetical protein